MLKFEVVSALVRAVFVCGILVANKLVAAEDAPGTAGYPPQVQPASQEGELAMKRFRVARGLKVELAAPTLGPSLRADVDWERGNALALRDGDDVFLSLRRTRGFAAAA